MQQDTRILVSITRRCDIGEPTSHGCVRMRSGDLVRLFDAVANGTLVDLQP